MQTRHTPGPWGLCDSSDARGKGYIRPIGPNAMTEDGRRPAICRIVDVGHTAEERRANERIIEAAPNMLAALLLIVEASEAADMATSARQGPDIKRMGAAMEAARKAIVDATMKTATAKQPQAPPPETTPTLGIEGSGCLVCGVAKRTHAYNEEACEPMTGVEPVPFGPRL